MAVLFPSFWTVIQHGCWVRLLIGSLTLCGWGSIPLLSAGVHAPACWGFPRLCSGGRGVGFSLFLVSAMFGRLSASLGWAHSLVGVCSWWFPFACGWAVISALRAAREHAPCWGCGCWVWWRWLRMRCRDAPVAVPGWCGYGGFLACGAFSCACAPCFGLDVLLCVTCVSVRVSRCARSAVYLSAVSCSVACCWFVAVCFVCRLLCGVRFVSAPAPTVTWFMSVCVGVRLTATVIVAYSLLCNGRFQRFALPTGMLVVFVSVSCRHKGWWGESGVRGRWRLVARRTT